MKDRMYYKLAHGIDIPNYENKSEIREEQSAFKRPSNIEQRKIDQVWAIIQRLRKNNGLTGKEIGEKIGESDVTVRFIVRHLRVNVGGDCARIASIPNYFLSETREELEPTIKMIETKYITEKETFEAVNKAYCPQLNMVL